MHQHHKRSRAPVLDPLSLRCGTEVWYLLYSVTLATYKAAILCSTLLVPVSACIQTHGHGVVSWQSQPSISAVCTHAHDRCDSFWFVHFICCGPSVLKTPDCPDDGQWIRPLYYSHLKPGSSRFPNHMAQEFLMSITVSLGGPDVWHKRKECLCLSLASLTSGQQLVFVCAGVEVRAAPGVQRQQKTEGGRCHLSKVQFIFESSRFPSLLCVWVSRQGLGLQRQGYVVLGMWHSPSPMPPESGFRLWQCQFLGPCWKDWGPSVVCPSCLSQACGCICSCPPSSPPVAAQTVAVLPSAAASVSMCCVTRQNQNNWGWKRVGL